MTMTAAEIQEYWAAERSKKQAHMENCLKRAAEMEAEGRYDVAETVLGWAIRAEKELAAMPK